MHLGHHHLLMAPANQQLFQHQIEAHAQSIIGRLGYWRQRGKGETMKNTLMNLPPATADSLLRQPLF